MDFDTLSQNVGDLGKLIVAKGFKTCPNSNKRPHLVTLINTTSWKLILEVLTWVRLLLLDNDWAVDSVTRLGDFQKFLVTNYPTKVAQMYGYVWAILENITSK